MKLHVERIRLNQGGYDRRGRYWGIGAPLYRVSSDDGEIDKHVRAPDARAARRLIEDAVRLVDRDPASGGTSASDRMRAINERRTPRDPARARANGATTRRRSGRDPVKTLIVRGRPYSVASHVVATGRPFAGELRYTLTGKRGGTYFTMRNVHRPRLMFLVTPKLSSSVMDGVWLTDEGGKLRVAHQ